MIRGCRQGREGAVSFPSDRELFRWISALRQMMGVECD